MADKNQRSTPRGTKRPSFIEQLIIEWIDEMRQQAGEGPMPEAYDQRTCITAAEVRGQGIPLPQSIPDVAWIPRAALQHALGEMTAADNGELRCQLVIAFAQPFRWLEGTIQRTGDGNELAAEQASR
jgi:hypothetical protein